jgi:hypothetical protein
LEILSEAVCFASPVMEKPYSGRSEVGRILSAVSRVLEDFTYQRVLAAGDSWALEFSARVGTQRVKGIDLIRLDEAGQIVEFEVFVRPLAGLRALAAEMIRLLN